jgi:hypothetical protein
VLVPLLCIIILTNPNQQYKCQASSLLFFKPHFKEDYDKEDLCSSSSLKQKCQLHSDSYNILRLLGHVHAGGKIWRMVNVGTIVQDSDNCSSTGW